MTDDVLKSFSTASEILKTRQVQTDRMYVVGGRWRGGGSLGRMGKVDAIPDMAQLSFSKPAAAVYCCGTICLTGPC